MNTVLNESAVIELMRQEHARASAKAEELWERLKTAEEAMAPQKAAYEAALHEWSTANRLAEALGALLKAKEPVVADEWRGGDCNKPCPAGEAA